MNNRFPDIDRKSILKYESKAYQSRLYRISIWVIHNFNNRGKMTVKVDPSRIWTQSVLGIWLTCASDFVRSIIDCTTVCFTALQNLSTYRYFTILLIFVRLELKTYDNEEDIPVITLFCRQVLKQQNSRSMNKTAVMAVKEICFEIHS